MKAPYDLSGLRFGRLLAVSKACAGRRTKWICLCDCGAIKEVATSNLVCGGTSSCGCLQKENISSRRAKHRASETPEYAVWGTMKARCNNPKNKSYGLYGGRGIKVCSRWENSFENFIQDMGSRPEGMSIERIDCNKGYSPDNCVWATAVEQNRNRRTTVKAEYLGKLTTISEIAEVEGVSYDSLLRLSKKYGIDTALVKVKRPATQLV